LQINPKTLTWRAFRKSRARRACPEEVCPNRTTKRTPSIKGAKLNASTFSRMGALSKMI